MYKLMHGEIVGNRIGAAFEAIWKAGLILPIEEEVPGAQQQNAHGCNSDEDKPGSNLICRSVEKVLWFFSATSTLGGDYHDRST